MHVDANLRRQAEEQLNNALNNQMVRVWVGMDCEEGTFHSVIGTLHVDLDASPSE